MLPKIWIFDTYSICMIIGVVLCLFTFDKFTRKSGYSKNEAIDYEITIIISVLAGVISAMLFQYVYDLIKDPTTIFSFKMTFFGGLIGGFACGLAIYRFKLKKLYNGSFDAMFKIAPACVTIAHGFGRIGCFMAGCCYGIKTDSIFGIKFPGMSEAVYPTQLFEAIFLLLLSVLLLYLAFKKNYKYSFVVYLYSYGVFRFLIEFIRGDARGFSLFGLSPSQLISIICVILATVLLILIKNKKLLKDE